MRGVAGGISIIGYSMHACNEMVRRAFPDFHVSIQEQIATDDRVIQRGINRGTHEADYLGIPTTGNKIEFGSIIVCRIENGKIVEEREFADMLSFMQQLGMELKPKEAK